MATHDYVIANGTGAAVRSDLNNALAAIVSNNSGSTEPGTTYAYQWWADTNANVLKIRNSANNAWITLRELDGTMLMENGSVSAPGLAFASDLDTGFFRIDPNDLGIATGGVQRLRLSPSEAVFNENSVDYDFRVESNGNTHMLFVDAGNDQVGIGISTPSKPLHIYQASDAGIRIQNSTTGTGTTDGLLLEATGSDGLLWNYESGNLRFATANSERARIDSSGRLQVGTSSYAGNGRLIAAGNTGGSSGTLDITYTGSRPTSAGTDIGYIRWYVAENSSGNAHYASIQATSDAVSSSTGDIPGRLVFSTTADSASSPSERMRINHAGQVGIGTTTVQHSVLAIAEATNGPTIEMRPNNSSISEIHSTNRGAGGNVPLSLRGSDVRIGSTGLGTTETARFDTNGRLYLGTTSPFSYTSTVAASIAFTGLGTEYGMALSATSGLSASTRFIEFADNTTVRGHIDWSGSAVRYNTSSDYRLKENIVPLSDALNRVKQLKPKRFNFIEFSDNTVDGFLAHEAQTVVPEAVTGTHNEVDDDNNPVYQGIDQSKLVPLLTAALQEAIAKIETLETKVAALEAG